MTWNANIDSAGPDGNPPYSFSKAIQSMSLYIVKSNIH
jgi:hypothetical protein